MAVEFSTDFLRNHSAATCFFSCKDLARTGSKGIKETKKSPMPLIIRTVGAIIAPLFVSIGFLCHRFGVRKEENQNKKTLREYQIADGRFCVAFAIGVLTSPLFALILPAVSALSTVLSLVAAGTALYKIGKNQGRIVKLTHAAAQETK